MLGQRRRRWPSIETAFFHVLYLRGLLIYWIYWPTDVTLCYLLYNQHHSDHQKYAASRAALGRRGGGADK